MLKILIIFLFLFSFVYLQEGKANEVEITEYEFLTKELIDINQIAQSSPPPPLSENYTNQATFSTDEDTKRHPLAKPYRSTDVLPLFAKQLGLPEEKRPLPFSVMLLGNYLQTSVVTSNFKGNVKTTAKIPGIGSLIPPSTIPVDLAIGEGSNIPAHITEVTQRFFTGGVRFAVNILPFWNVYGIFAQSTGTTTSGIQVGTTPPIDFTMAFDASSFGFGTSLAIGGKLFFTAADVNYVVTTVESINNMIYTVNASMRVGLYKNIGTHAFAMWVGGNYMENIGGSKKLGAVISVERLKDILDLRSIIGNLASMIENSAANITWAVDQRPKNVFSAAVGMRYSPTRNFDIVTEVSFIDRVNVMVSAAYNF